MDGLIIQHEEEDITEDIEHGLGRDLILGGLKGIRSQLGKSGLAGLNTPIYKAWGTCLHLDTLVELGPLERRLLRAYLDLGRLL